MIILLGLYSGSRNHRQDNELTDYQGVLRELLKEALLGGAVDVKVEGLGRQHQGRKGKHREQHRVHREGRYS